MRWLGAALALLASKPVLAAVGLVVSLLLPVSSRLASRGRVREVHRRGALIEHRSRRFRWPRLGVDSGGVTLAGVSLTPADETKHFKLIGTTGTGKSTAISELVTCALRRGDRAIISDPDGSYLAAFGNRFRGDAILNPFERDSWRWDLFGELQHSYDVEQLASALIPTSADSSAQEWRGYARTFVAAVVRRCHESGRHDLSQLWWLLAIASLDELRSLLIGTTAQPFLEPDNARMFGSIRSVAVSAMAALEYVRAQRAPLFSVREWIRTGRGVLFIPYRAGQIAAMRSMIAAWLRLAIFEIMNRPIQQQRLWVVIDELDALGAIDGLKDALARLRKFGGCCVLGFQSIAQVSSTYGHGEAQTIIENCSNTLILRCSSSENGGTSQFASRLIGEREVLRRQVSRGSDRAAMFARAALRRSTQVSDQPAIESAVLASELEQLPDLIGYLKTASARNWRRVQLQISRSI